MRRRASLALVLALLAAACSGSNDATTAPSTSTTATSGTVAPTTTTKAPDTAQMPTFDDDADPIPDDGVARIGTLDNGLTYYVRRNTAPGGRAQLRLAVRAGSLQEAADQRGVAHYLEHMMFNGTARYPANELVRVLQRFGAEFGADINAYTSYEETVYQLELPTDDPDTLAAGFDVLLEWATAVTLDPAEVDLERGVLVEEWRLRDQGFWGRYYAAVTARLLAGTDYEGHETLGTPDEVAATTPESLRAFYDTWYRTDTMAVVAVGDFDVSTVENLIRERFGTVAGTTDPPPVVSPTTAPADEPTFLVLTDPETVQTWAELNYPLPADTGAGTVGAVRRGLAFDLAWTMLVTRLQETSLRGEAPFWDASFAANPLVNGQRSPGVAAYTTPEDLAETTEILLAEVRRSRLHGFSQSELERAIEDVRSDVQLAYDERGTTQDRNFADDYAQGFLSGTAVPSAEDWHDLQMRLLDEMTADQVWNTFGAELDTTEPFVIAVAPQQRAASAPDEENLRDIVARVDTTTYEPWIDDTTALETLMERPRPADVAARGQFSDTYLTVITLSNGARVVFLPTTIRNDVVVFRAASPGGWAPLPPGDVAEAQMVSDIIASSGVGTIDQVTLDRSLAGRVVSLTPYFDEVEEGFYGEAASRDVETLLQLVHLYMTAPRFEQVGLGIAVAETLPYASDPGQIPDLAVAIAAADARFGGDVRFGPIPTEDDLLTLDLARAGEIFRDHFDDPGDFVFVFTGDFDEAEVEDLSRRYLGTIPGPGDVESWVDVRPDPPVGIVQKVVEAGTGELGGITFLFSTETALNPDRRIAIDLLELVLQQRITERIREQLSASYSPYTYVELVEDPSQGVELWIQISGDPADLDAISTQTLDVLADLRATGPTADEMAIASEQLLRDYELISNEALSQAIVFSALHPDEVLSEITARIDRTFEPTGTQIRDLARLLLPADRYVEVRLIPESR